MTPKEVLGKVLGRPLEVVPAPLEYVVRLGKWFGTIKSYFGDLKCKIVPRPIDSGYKYGKLTKCSNLRCLT